MAEKWQKNDRKVVKSAEKVPKNVERIAEK